VINATARERRIPSIQLIHLKHVLAEFSRMDLAQRERLADELHERQPNLFASCLVLRNMGASYAQLGVALQALFVTWLAMQRSGRSWPLVTEAVQEDCATRPMSRCSRWITTRVGTAPVR
jgi:hypothetical protein